MNSAFAKRIGCLFTGIVLAFLALLGWQAYWHLERSAWLFDQPTNKRTSRLETKVPRGTLYDRNGEALAWGHARERIYADPSATAALIGYLDPVYGRAGIEGRWNAALSGISETFTANDLARMLRHERPRGHDLSLTLDLSLQRAATKALDGHIGAVVLLDPASGGILAAATSPTFNAATIRDDYARLSADRRGPLRHRAFQDVYPPGSTMKLVTAAAALMHGVGAETVHTCAGKSRIYNVNVSDYHGMRHGALAMERALTVSCNHYFAYTAAELPQADFVSTATSFGFGRRWWQDAPTPRVLPVTPALSSLAPDTTQRISRGERAHMGFGQSTVVATPLQMAMVAAAIANDGTLMAPHLVSAVRKGGSGPALVTYRPRRIGYPLDRDTARTLAGMMRHVVASGTGRAARVDGLTVYGKTGTAQQRGGADHAWFVGFAERDRDGATQRLAFAVLIERGGGGGRVAAPVAGKVLARWQEME